MSDSEQRFFEDRANRDAARQLVDSGVARVKADLSARSIGGRIKDKAIGEVEDALATGVEVARENKGIVAGTIGLLLVWFLRAPLGRLTSGWFGGKPQDIEDADASTGSDKE